MVVGGYEEADRQDDHERIPSHGISHYRREFRERTRVYAVSVTTEGVRVNKVFQKVKLFTTDADPTRRLVY